MAERFKSHELHRSAKVAASLSTATEFVSNIARSLALSRAMSIGHQYDLAKPKDPGHLSSPLGRALLTKFAETPLTVATTSFRDAAARFLKVSIGSSAVNGAIHAPVGLMNSAFIGVGSLDVAGDPTSPAKAVKQATLTMLPYFVGENWVTVQRNIRKATPVLSKAVTFVRNLAEIAIRSRHTLSPSWEPTVASLLQISQSPFANLARVRPGGGLRNMDVTPRAMSMAMLAIPMLIAPVIASVQPERTPTNASNASAIVINSSPTITINSNEPEEIEQRMLEVLKQHREAIFAQWCAELQRRKRTEF